MSDANAKQQIVEKIKGNTSILVTVSNNPTVDDLSAALGLTILLNKMKKHATAVFSGEIPPAITFLDPEKTFENTVDSLRDFIIALDKEKADHLRYKVEGDVVKIFVTPYRTTITSNDLEFSQGDYNVEMVLALGVKSQDNLDRALAAHGRILHDATVATIVAGSDKSDLGTTSWRDENASSLSEMIFSLSEALKVDKTLVDEQIATALLAGIVAATDRFSNNRTSARVMTMSAQLMSAGANQQLIASKFEENEDNNDDQSDSFSQPEEPAGPTNDTELSDSPDSSEDESNQTNRDGTTDLSEGESTKLDRNENQPNSESSSDDAKGEAHDGTLHISHEKAGTLEEVAEQTASEKQLSAAEAAEAHLARQAKDVTQKDQLDATAAAEEELSKQLPTVVAPTPDISPSDLRKDVEAIQADVEATAASVSSSETAEVPSDSSPLQGAVSSEVWQNNKIEQPALGGTLNATTEEAQIAKRAAEAADLNRTILSHAGTYMGDQTPTYNSPLNATNQPPEDETMVNPLHGETAPTVSAAPLQPPAETLSDLDSRHRYVSEPAQPASVDSSGLPPLPDFSTLPPLPPDMNGAETNSDTGKLGDILPPADNSQPSNSSDPGQFKIPGQS